MMPSGLQQALDATLRAVSCCSPAPFGDTVTHVITCKVLPWEWRNNCRAVAQTTADHVADELSVEWQLHRLTLRVERKSLHHVRLRCELELRSRCVRLEVDRDHPGDPL